MLILWLFWFERTFDLKVKKKFRTLFSFCFIFYFSTEETDLAFSFGEFSFIFFKSIISYTQNPNM